MRTKQLNKNESFSHFQSMTVDMKSLIKLAKQRRSESVTFPADNTASSEPENLILACEQQPTCKNVSDSRIGGLLVSNNFLPLVTCDKIYRFLQKNEADFVQLRGRRCRPFGGQVTENGLVKTDDIPSWLKQLMNAVHTHILVDRNLPAPNHALINVYEAGDGIMAHEDGPAYTPYATVLSLGSGSVFNFVAKDPRRSIVERVYLPVGSVFLFCEDAYMKVLHEFASNKTDDLVGVKNLEELDPTRLGFSKLSEDEISLRRGKRVSITMRHVPYC
jgi:alkylated DNA repair protein alkB family protein 6